MFVRILRKKFPALGAVTGAQPRCWALSLASVLGLVSCDRGLERGREGRVLQLALWTSEPTQEGSLLHKARFSWVSFCSTFSLPWTSGIGRF